MSLVLYKNNQIQGSNLHQPVVMPFCIAIGASFILRHLQCSHDNYIYYFLVTIATNFFIYFYFRSLANKNGGNTLFTLKRTWCDYHRRSLPWYQNFAL